MGGPIVLVGGEYESWEATVHQAAGKCLPDLGPGWCRVGCAGEHHVTLPCAVKLGADGQRDAVPRERAAPALTAPTFCSPQRIGLMDATLRSHAFEVFRRPHSATVGRVSTHTVTRVLMNDCGWSTRAAGRVVDTKKRYGVDHMCAHTVLPKSWTT